MTRLQYHLALFKRHMEISHHRGAHHNSPLHTPKRVYVTAETLSLCRGFSVFKSRTETRCASQCKDGPSTTRYKKALRPNNLQIQRTDDEVREEPVREVQLCKSCARLRSKARLFLQAAVTVTVAVTIARHLTIVTVTLIARWVYLAVCLSTRTSCRRQHF